MKFVASVFIVFTLFIAVFIFGSFGLSELILWLKWPKETAPLFAIIFALLMGISLLASLFLK